MRATKSASRYAKALLELAIEQGNTESVAADMNALLEAYNDSRDFQLFLSSPIINADKKSSILANVFEQFGELSSSFIQLIVKNGREAALPQIADSYIAQLKQHMGIIPVTLVSATTMDDKTKNTIVSKLEGSLNGKLELDEQIDASLIGGFIVKMGDTQIDASVASKLKNLKVSLTR